MAIVSNASPLIAFRQLNRLDMLQTLLDVVKIPPAVQQEVFHSTPQPAWLEIHRLKHPVAPQLLTPRLGPGEREAISLALELGAAQVLLDDLAARRAAVGFGLAVTGTFGLLIEARRQGLIPAVKPELDLLVRLNFRVSPQIYRSTLHAVNEL